MSDPTPAPASDAPSGTLPVLLAPPARGTGGARWLQAAVVVLAALSIASFTLAWRAEQRGASLEQELVRRQQDSATAVGEARALAKRAEETAVANAAKVALTEARLADVATQRGQLDDLVQSVSRSREESLLTDVESGIRVALQQTAITGSAEPLVAALKQGDDRLERYNQPRLEGVRRAIVRDLDRVRATGVADVSSLGIKLDEAMRLVDELPLVSGVDARGGREGKAVSARSDSPGAVPASAPATGWTAPLQGAWNRFGAQVWSEARSLVRVTRIDHPEGMLLAPEQSFFVRENLKLRLLNARLALLSRQFDTAQADLQDAQATIDRYFDRSARRTQLIDELLRQVAGQARQVVVPRPDDTFAALAAAASSR